AGVQVGDGDGFEPFADQRWVNGDTHVGGLVDDGVVLPVLEGAFAPEAGPNLAQGAAGALLFAQLVAKVVDDAGQVGALGVSLELEAAAVELRLVDGSLFLGQAQRGSFFVRV